MSKKITFVFIGIIILFIGIIIGLATLLVSQEVQGLVIGSTGSVVTIKSEIDMDNAQITKLGAPDNPNGAATKSTVDTTVSTAQKWADSGGDLSRETGSIGIGTTSPQAKLHVKALSGGACVGYAMDCGDLNKSDCGSTTQIPQFGCYWAGTKCEGVASACSVLSQSQCPYQFGCSWSGVPTVALFENGRVGIGVSSPAYRLELPNIASLDGRGRANSWTTYSSIRWKENIIPIVDALKKLVQVQGVYFNWKPEYGGTKGIGLIAEDVGKIIPEVVEYEADGIYAKSLDYDHLVALVIEAIKEQQEQINQLKQEIEELKAIIREK